MSGNDRPTERLPFDEVWKKMPRRDDLSAFGTLETVSYREEQAPQLDVLPEVGHMLDLGHVLGAGGSGEVLSATQKPLNRTIAVKRPLRTDESDNSDRLQREARVIGYLEHPNIPPVHFMGVDAEGQLLVGLKRIEGDTFYEQATQQSQLDMNIDVLIQVCNAVGYAHSRGIVHLDLKPDNIMTGQFGEVYVLDWGLAVAFSEHAPEALPRPEKDSVVRGTPAFLAPESVVALAPTAATDVYQLGGILHMMLTGSAPNAGDTVFEAVHAAYSPPERLFDSHVPVALTEICRKALAVDPLERYFDGDALKEALIDFRRHWQEIGAVESARRQVVRLETLLEESQQDEAVVYQAYGGARQSIDHVSSLFSDTTVTVELLQRVLEAMIDWELTHARAAAANILLSELPTPNSELESRCREEAKQRAQDIQDLQAFRHHNNPFVGNTSKIIYVIGIGVTIGLLQIVPHLMGIEATPRRVLNSYLAYIVVLTVVSVVLRKQLLQTQINRAATLTIWLLTVFGLTTRLGVVMGVMPLYAGAGYDMAVVTMMNFFVAVSFDKRLLTSVPIYALGAAGCFVWSSTPMLSFGIAHFVALTTMAFSLAYMSEDRSKEMEI